MTDMLLPELRPRPDVAPPAPPDPFDELTAASRGMCQTAVDATDIAVMLEMGGINDAIATGTYGARDVHDLAERLLRAVPARSPALVLAASGPGHDARTSARLIGRGALYAAPGAFYVAIAGDLHSAWAGLAVIGTTATGWMASQVIGFVAYRLTERSGAENTHAVLRRAVLAAVPVAVMVAAAGERAVGPLAATVLAAQVVFAAAAAVLLFYDADRVLAYCVIPGATVAVVCAVGWTAPVPPWLPPLVAATAALLTAFVTARAAWTVRGAVAGPVRYPGGRDLAGTLPSVLYGLLCAAALAVRPIMDMTGPDGGAPAPGSALAVLPVVLVMGYGELEIRRLRTSCERNASVSTTMRHYRCRARADLARLELRMAGALAATVAATTAAIWATSSRSGIPPAELLRSAASLALGCALIAGLIGCSFGRPAQAALAFLLAFAAAAVTGLTVTPLDPRTPAGYLAACVLLLAAVNVAAVRVVQNPIAVIG